MKKVWAIDLGASNGRLMVSSFNGQRIDLEEIHRFSNQPIHVTNHFYWDILRIFQEIKNGMMKSRQNGHGAIESLSIDTWGVDFGLLSRKGELLGNPYSYRDPHTKDSIKEIEKKIPREELFYRTGVEPSAINTICQLVALQNQHEELLEQAETLLMTPNLIGYLLSGEMFNEYTISTTTSLFNVHEYDWDINLMKVLNLPTRLMARIVQSGTELGSTMDSINHEIGMKPVRVMAGPGHDTACAVAALPMKNNQSAFMSCGTWILIGVETDKPVVNENALKWGFTNEGTAEGKNRLLKNIMGLWLVQACRVIWSKQGKTVTYEEENFLIQRTKPFQRFIDPDDPAFFNPKNMVDAIRDFCIRTNQAPPTSPGEYLRSILESLALKYKWVIERLEMLTGNPIETIHMGGGGIQNEYLCQFTANATNRTVIAGPVEASSIGNALSQWIALGEIKDYTEGKAIVEQSFPVKTYQPVNQSEWEEAYGRFIHSIIKERF